MKPSLSRSLRIAVAAALLSLPLAPAASARDACAAQATGVSLSGFPAPMGGQPPFFYAAAENPLPSPFKIRVFMDCVENSTVTVNYATDPGSATAPADFSDTDGQATTTADEQHDTDELTIHVPIQEDTADEALAESFTARIVSAMGGGAQLSSPTSAPFYILDDEGPSSARFVPGVTNRTVGEAYSRFGTKVVIPVFRGGASLPTVGYSVSPQTPDVTPSSGNVAFPLAGGQLGFISLTIADDTQDESNETFTISLDGPTIEGDNSVSLTVTDDDGGGGGGDTTPAPTWFHHPKHGETYREHSAGADTIHVFVREDPVDILQVRVALRKKTTGGNCQWWNGNRWDPGSCASANANLFRVNQHYPNSSTVELFLYAAYPDLRPSIGTRIRNYTVYAKSTDTSGNTSDFRVGDSQNTFEVRPR